MRNDRSRLVDKMNYQGLFDEIDSATCAISQIDEAIDLAADKTTQSELIALRKSYLLTRVQLISELHNAIQAQWSGVAA